MNTKVKKVLGFEVGKLAFCNRCANPVDKTFLAENLGIIIGVHKEHHNMVVLYNLSSCRVEGWYHYNITEWTPEWRAVKSEEKE